MAKRKRKPTPPTVVTLTIPDAKEDEERSGTITARRGDLASVRQFTFATMADVLDAIHAAAEALAGTEAAPPDFPNLHQAGQPPYDEEGAAEGGDEHPLVITLTLPGEGGLVRASELVARRGDLASIHRFEYADMGDIGAALRRGAEALVAFEADPPAYFPTFDQATPGEEQVTVSLYVPHAEETPASPLPEGEFEHVGQMLPTHHPPVRDGDNPIQLSLL
jgi:hypothetical protein